MVAANPASSSSTSISSATRLEIRVSNSSGRVVESVVLPGKATVAQLKTAISRDCKKLKLAVNRQRLTLPPTGKPSTKKTASSISSSGAKTVLEEERSLISYGLQNGSTVIVKDLGPQISWRNVFILEYLGPLLIHQAYFFNAISLQNRELSILQVLAYLCVTFHFLKREYETLFVHRFSHATMPLSNLFKNSAHYWLLSGVGIGHFLYSPSFQAPDYVSDPRVLAVLIGVFAAAELANFRTHLILRDLRPEGSTKRAIPCGFGFALVSCPNYFFEMLAWIAFSVLTGLPSAWFFTVVATGQMWLWAVKKHRRYLQEFPDYPRSRYPMVPFLC